MSVSLEQKCPTIVIEYLEESIMSYLLLKGATSNKVISNLGLEKIFLFVFGFRQIVILKARCTSAGVE